MGWGGCDWNGFLPPVIARYSLKNQFAGKMNGLPKVIFSKTLDSVEWENSSLIKDNVKETVLKLKQQPGKDMVILGSGSIVSAFTQMDLIDEYRIIINPVILGDGKLQFTGDLDKKC